MCVCVCVRERDLLILKSRLKLFLLCVFYLKNKLIVFIRASMLHVRKRILC